jgi:lipooligosaccharide transport system permease protein
VIASRPQLRALLEWPAWAVFGRNLRVYTSNWKTAVVPPALEPLIYFLAFGLGLGRFVDAVPYDGGSVRYVDYVAPGLLAFTCFNSAFFEALYGSYVRLHYQKTWDGILTTQVEVEHIVWGEALWAAARGVLNASIVALVLGALALAGLIDIALPWLLVAPLFGFVAGWAFAVFALIFTAIVPAIDHLNYPVFLIGVPLGLISNTYFPLPTDAAWMGWLQAMNPLYHLAELIRGGMLGGPVGPHVLGLGLSGLVLLFVSACFAQPLVRRRVLKG